MEIRNPVVFMLIIYLIAGIAILSIAAFSINYVGAIPNDEMTTVNIGFLTASSIAFGFCGSSFIRFSDKMLDLKLKASDLASELCNLYDIVNANKKLSSLTLCYDSSVPYYGGKKHLGAATGKAPKVIESAYQCIVNNFRFQLNFWRKLFYPLLRLLRP